MKKLLKVLIYTSIVLFALFWVGIFIVSQMGGKDAEWKGHFEAILASVLDRDVTFGSFEKGYYYPEFILKAGEVSIAASDTEPAITIETLNVGVSFWSIFWGEPAFTMLDVKNARPSNNQWAVKSLGLPEEITEDPIVALAASYEGADINLSIAMERAGQNGVAMRAPIPVSGTIAGVNLSTELTQTGGGVRLEQLSLSDDQHTVSGNLKFDNGDIVADIDFGQSKARLDLKLDVSGSRPSVSGEVIFDVLNMADLDGDSFQPVRRIVDSIAPQSEENQGIDLSFADLDLSVNVREFILNDTDIGDLRTPVRLQNGALKIGDISGTFSGGDLSGMLALDASSLPAQMTADLMLKEWVYGDLQRAAFGRADIEGEAQVKVNLASSGETYGGLRANLSGAAGLIAGEGHFPAEMLNLWNSGLVNMLVPDLDAEAETQLNCAVIEFALENGVADTATLFFDGKRMTLQGQGTIDLVNERIDLILKPESKGIELLKVSPAVKVTGALTSPDIGPSNLSLLGNIGKIVIGTINPATLVFTMTDFGLGKDHPCNAYIGGDEAAE